jgi:flagellar biosynthesis anti-sigma factor FlgM
MDIRNNLQGLQEIFRGNETSAGHGVARNGARQPVSAPEITGDEARVSTTASLASQAVAGSDVRMDKVNSVRAALASGSYQVSSSAVAGKMIDHMLNG